MYRLYFTNRLNTKGNMKQYIHVNHTNRNELERQVNEFINDGYIPLSGPIFCPAISGSRNGIYCVAMFLQQTDKTTAPAKKYTRKTANK